MPRPSSKVPSYRLHKSSGQAIVTLGGHMVYLGPFGTPASKQKYQQVVAEFLANFEVPVTHALVKTLTVVELAAAYWKFAKAYYRQNGEPTSSLIRVKVAIRILKETYGQSATEDFGPLALRVIQDKLVRGGKSRRYVNYLIDQIRRIFKWGVAQQLLDVTTYQALTTVSGLRRGRTAANEPAPIAPVSDEIVATTLPHLHPVVADMVRFQRLTGCRPGEVCQLRPCDVDIAGEVWIYRPVHHKTAYSGKTRAVCIGPKAQAVLRRYLLKASTDYCFSPRDSEKSRLEKRHARRTTPLQQGNRPGTNRTRRPIRQPGSRYSPSSYLRAVTRACELAFGMPADIRKIGRKLTPELRQSQLKQARLWRQKNCWTPNQLRHTAATEIRSGFGLEAAQVTLGHANATITQIYAERDLMKAAEVMKRIG